MKCEILGKLVPAVCFTMDAGESIYNQSGSMVWMTDGIKMTTSSKGGLLKGFARALLTQESVFMNTFTAEKTGAKVAFGMSFPGEICQVHIQPGYEIIAQKGAFLCAETGVKMEVTTVKKLGGGFFGGEGFFLQKYSGEGYAFLEIDGDVVEYTLEAGQTMRVDSGNVAYFESSVQYSVEMVKGFKNVLFGGEGLFLTTLTGPGKIWLQTATISELAGRIIPFLPKN